MYAAWGGGRDRGCYRSGAEAWGPRQRHVGLSISVYLESERGLKDVRV